MEPFTHYQINETEHGIEIVLYLDERLTEFSDELGTTVKMEESNINKEAVSFVKRMLPSLKVKTVKIMAGAMLLTTFGLGTLSANHAEAAESTITPLSYTVSAGDTLSEIAKRNGTTVDAIKQTNKLAADLIHIGHSLTLPADTTSAPTQANGTTYKVVSGDTLSEIAKRNGTTVDTIKQVNQLSSDLIHVGQSLTLPAGTTSAPTQANGTTYKVVSGDTLSEIAKRNGTTVDAIKQVNRLSSDLIHVGQSLTIPTETSLASPLPQTEQQSEVNQEEVEWLAKMIYSEGRGESFEGQIAVGAVIMNRVESPLFPNNIKDVLFEKSNGYFQFTPAATGSIHTATPNAENIDAAKRAIKGEDPTNGALFFFNPDKTSSPYLKSRAVSTIIGNHTFAY